MSSRSARLRDHFSDLTDPRRVRWAACLGVFFVLRVPWYGSTLALHHGVLHPAHLLQDAFGLAALGLLFWLPTRGDLAASKAGRGNDAALSGDRSQVVLARQEQPALDPNQPAPDLQAVPGDCQLRSRPPGSARKQDQTGGGDAQQKPARHICDSGHTCGSHHNTGEPASCGSDRRGRPLCLLHDAPRGIYHR